MDQIVVDMAPSERLVNKAKGIIKVVNPDDGIGMDEVLDAVERRLPTIEGPLTVVVKRIIYIERYEMRSCESSITALVSVYCRGLVTEEWPEVSGLYQILIRASAGEDKCYLKVDKYSPEVLHIEEVPFLPQDNAHVERRIRQNADDLGESDGPQRTLKTH